MTFEQGDIVLASDPFKDSSTHEETPIRPCIIVNTSNHPFHGRQYTLMSLSTKEHEAGVEILDDFLQSGHLDQTSYALPWSISSLEFERIHQRVGVLKPVVVEVLITELFQYIAPEDDKELQTHIA